MIDNTYLEFFLRIFYNSFLVFILSWTAIEGGLHLFKIKNPRLRAIMKSIPIFKLPIDLFFYSWINWKGIENGYLFGCTGFVKKLLFSSFEDGKYPSFAHVILTNIDPVLVSYFLLTVMTVSALLVIYDSCRLFLTLKNVNAIRKASNKCLRPIQNLHLARKLSEKGIIIHQSEDSETPFAAAQSMIVIPAKLVHELSQEEYEAIVAHELEHIRWQDTWVRAACQLFSSLFWWLPSRKLLREIYETQEYACDASIKKYLIQSHDFMSAMLKAAKFLKDGADNSLSYCRLLSKPFTLSGRFEKLTEIVTICTFSSYSAITIALGIMLIRFFVC